MSRYTIWVRGIVKSLDLANIFSTRLKSAYLSNPGVFMEMVITVILLCLILALTNDGKVFCTATPLTPLLIDISIAVIITYIGGREVPYLISCIDRLGG